MLKREEGERENEQCLVCVCVCVETNCNPLLPGDSVNYYYYCELNLLMTNRLLLL